MILGMSFRKLSSKNRWIYSLNFLLLVKNAYMLINFGDFVDGSPNNTADPYIQLLPTTNMQQAHQDFVNIRLGGVDTTSSQPPLLPTIQTMLSENTSSTLPSIF